MYNMVSEEKLPLVFCTIDNFDLVKEEMQDLEAYINQFATGWSVIRDLYDDYSNKD